MDSRGRWACQGRVVRRDHVGERRGIRSHGRRFYFLGSNYAFVPRDGHQLPVGVGMTELERALPGRLIRQYDTIDSTMQAALGCPLGTVVLAEEQTAGQGRHGHSWHSQRGAGIYCSIVLKPAPLLTLALGLATAESITSTTGLACDL